ncbi:MAG: hypothetical protein ACTSQI_14530 [Candidatus Helarchaeota archaeon]
MGIGKIIGSILALASGLFVLISVFFLNIKYHVPLSETWMLVDLLLAILVIVGGILGLTGKKWGGAFALIGGAVWLVGMLLAMTAGVWEIMIVSIFWIFFPSTIEVIYFGIIEIMLAIIGGIIILASGE